MGINHSIPDNNFSYRDIIKCLQDSDNVHDALKIIFNKSTFLNIEDYFDDTCLNCCYESNDEEFKLYFTCLDCNISKLCPFCFILGEHNNHKFKRELLNLTICSCSVTSSNKCFKHKSLKSINYSLLFKDENPSTTSTSSPTNNNSSIPTLTSAQSPTTINTTTTTTTTTTTATHSLKSSTTEPNSLNSSIDKDIFLPNYIDYKNLIVYMENSKSNLKELSKLKTEIHLFIRYIIIFLVGKPLRPNKKANNQLYSGYIEVLKFLNYCARRSKFISNVIGMELLSTNIDLDSLLDENNNNCSNDNNNKNNSNKNNNNNNNNNNNSDNNNSNCEISLFEIIDESDVSKDIRSTIKFKSADDSELNKYPTKLTVEMGSLLVKGKEKTVNKIIQDQKIIKESIILNKEKENKGEGTLCSGKTYMNRFRQYFSRDLKEAHIDLFSTLIDRSKTFKIFFFRHFFDIRKDDFSPNNRYEMYMLDKFYNDEDLISIWIEKSSLIKEILFRSALFHYNDSSFDPIRFLPDIIRSNKSAAIRLVRRDLQKITTLVMYYESFPMKVQDVDNDAVRIRNIYFTQNIIFTFLYLYKQQTPFDLLKYFNLYLDSLSDWKSMLSSENELTHFNYYTCLPMLLSAAVIENESNYMKLQLQSWEKATKYTYLLARYYVLSQISYFTTCKKKSTSTLAQFPIQGIEISATINALQILSLCNFKKVLECFFKNPISLFSTDSIFYNAFPTVPTHLAYHFLYIILKSNHFYFDGDCYSSGIENYEYKKMLKYHIVNLIYRGIDVPLDLGRSNSVLRNCSEKDVYDIIEEVSTILESSNNNDSGDQQQQANVQSKSNQIKGYDFILTTRVHSTMPSLKIQNTSLTNNRLKIPNHCSRKVKEAYMKCVDDDYHYTNVYHLFYYGFPSLNYPLESLKLNTFDNEMGPTKGTPFSIHSSDYLNKTLKEPLLYKLLFRDLLFTVYDLAEFSIDGYPPIVQKGITIKSKKISISIDILKIVLYILQYTSKKLTTSELAAIRLETSKYDSIKINSNNPNKQQFKPSITNCITLLLETFTVTDFSFSSETVTLSIMDLVFKISTLSDGRVQYANSIIKLYNHFK